MSQSGSVEKKRLASLYPDQQSVGRNDGAAMFLGYNLKKYYSKEIEYAHIAPWADYRPYGKFDLWLHVDFGEDALGMADIERPRPLAYWSSDTHLGYAHRLRMAKSADHVFVAQKRAKEEFERDGVKDVTWLPHAYEPDCYKPGIFDNGKWINAKAKKRYDIGFVGHLQDKPNHLGFSRVDALERGFKHSKNIIWAKRFFEKASNLYNESKVVLNCTIGDDVPMRFFEALGAGAFLITNHVPTINELFEDGKHLVTYKTLDEMDEKIAYYLKHDDEREAIAEAGHQHVLANHTYKHRLDTLLKKTGLVEAQEAKNVGV